jgi:signal transduction histidine kinase
VNARNGLNEARHSVCALRSPGLDDADFCMAFQGLLDQSTRETDLQASVQIRGTPWTLPADWQEHLLRMAREALTNTLKHAHARRFEARLNFEPHELRVELWDDGIGFDPTIRNGGFGLMGMNERVETMGGRLILRTAAGQGTAISVVLPCGTPS